MKTGSRLLNTSRFGLAMWENDQYKLEKERKDLARTSEQVHVFFPEDFPSTCVKRERCDWEFCDDPRYCAACLKDVYSPLISHDQVVAWEPSGVFEGVKVVVCEEIHASKSIGNENKDCPVKLQKTKKSKEKQAEPLFHEKHESCPAEMMQFCVPVEFAH